MNRPSVFKSPLMAILGAGLVLLASSSWAGELSPAQLAQLKQKLTQNLPDFPPIDSAQTTPMSGLIELRSGNNIIYTDP